jgi:hypothetical protein
MGIALSPFAEVHVEAVKALNERLRAGGAPLAFPETHVSPTLPRIDGREIYDEYFLAVEGDDVRGAYILKRQPFFIGGEVVSLAQYRLPVSEGLIDKRYASVGVQMYLDAVRREPRMYTIGLGGYEEALSQLLVKAGWSTWTVPFYFRVLRAGPFLRNIVYLRTSNTRRVAFDVLAATGLGALAVHAYQRWKTRGTPRERSRVEIAEEPAFGSWADDIWQAAKSDFTLIGVRDAANLNILFPASEPRWLRLRMSNEGRTVGWAVVLDVPMQAHSYFGDMRVGSLIDCLALPGMESRIASAAVEYLGERGSDIVVANMAHHRWRAALSAAGMIEGPSNYIFAASKPVAAMLQPFDEKVHGIHMTRGDGAGAENLIEVRK